LVELLLKRNSNKLNTFGDKEEYTYHASNMNLKNAFLADAATVDASGKLNAVGIFDVIFFRSLPAVHRDMALVIRLEGAPSEKGDYALSVELRDDQANKLASFDQQIALKPAPVKGNLRAQVLMNFRDVPFRTAGQYEFVIFVNQRFLGRVTFVVQKVRVEEAGEA
jgi:hypothetical protein